MQSAQCSIIHWNACLESTPLIVACLRGKEEIDDVFEVNFIKYVFLSWPNI
jgi:hypothetical protein